MLIPLLELETDEIIEDVLLEVHIQIYTNKGEISESFYSLEDAEEYYDKVREHWSG